MPSGAALWATHSPPAGTAARGGGNGPGRRERLEADMSRLVPLSGQSPSPCRRSVSGVLGARARACFSPFIFRTLAEVFQMRTLLCFPFLYYTLLQFVNTGYRCYLRPHFRKKSPSRAPSIYLKFCIRSHVSSSRRSHKVKQSPLACSV